MLAFDVVVLDRHEAERIAVESADVLTNLRRLEAALYDARDDAGRALYAQVRVAMASARWVSGALTEAVS